MAPRSRDVSFAKRTALLSKLATGKAKGSPDVMAAAVAEEEG